MRYAQQPPSRATTPCGSQWLALGFELVEVSRLLGHQELSTTARWCMGIPPGRLASRFDLVDGAREAEQTGKAVAFPSRARG